MKTLKLIFAMLVIGISNMSFATITEPVMENNVVSKSRISEIVKSQIEFPVEMASYIQEGFVAVKISFDASDQLIIRSINASDKSLQNYVEKQLKKVVILNASKSFENDMYLKFIFHNRQ